MGFPVNIAIFFFSSRWIVLAILSLVAEMRKKASVKLSDALIHITSPALASHIFGLAEWRTGDIWDTRKETSLHHSCLKIQLGMRPTLPLSLCYFLHYSFDVFVLAQHKVKRRSVIILNDWWVHTINFWTIFGWWCLAWPLGCGKKLLSNYQTLWYTSHRPCSKLLKSWVQEP